MSKLPDYVALNRDAWTRWGAEDMESCRRAWAREAINWGIWGVEESSLSILGALSRFRDKDVLDLGCGTGYFSAWFARLGARPVGLDITPAQLERAREFQCEFGIDFPLIEASAEAVPFPDDSFDFILSEYGASIWCDPYEWIPEASRLLRKGGELFFLRNSHLSILCGPDVGAVTEALARPSLGLCRIQYDAESVEFQPSIATMNDILRSNDFELVRLVDIYPPDDAKETRYDYMRLEWAKKWPSEEIWHCRKIDGA